MEKDPTPFARRVESIEHPDGRRDSVFRSFTAGVDARLSIGGSDASRTASQAAVNHES